MEDRRDETVVFEVAGRDPILRISIGGWEWGYNLRAVSATVTEVTVWYRWSFLMTVFGCGTTGGQAANEIVELALALDALAWSHGESKAGP